MPSGTTGKRHPHSGREATSFPLRQVPDETFSCASRALPIHGLPLTYRNNLSSLYGYYSVSRPVEMDGRKILEMRRATEETAVAPPSVLHAAGASSSLPRRTGGAPAVSGGLAGRLRTDPGTHRCGNVGMGARTRCGRSPAGHREPARSAHVAATTEQGRQPGLGVPSTWVVRAVLGSLFPAVLLVQDTSPRVEAVSGLQVQSTGPVAREPLTHRDHGRGPDARLRRGRE